MRYYMVVDLHKLQPHDTGIHRVDAMGRIKYVYTDEELAMNAASDMATLNPKHQIAVFQAVSTVETKVPVLIHKTFTETGELVPKTA